jgi:polysaccharide deacetylase family protein (PEP-CTERM system associated)
MAQVCLDTRSTDRPIVTGDAAPFISVIVPVRNEAAFIRNTLEPLLRQTYDAKRYEVIVADGESTDGTPEIVRELQQEHPNLLLLRNPNGWSSFGRNVGIRAARGDYIVVVDGHSELDSPDYLEDLADAFARSGADCIGRPQPLDVTDATPLQRAIAVARSSFLGHHPASYIYDSGERYVKPQSVGVAYRRDVFKTVGLFDESFDACEDVEFNHRVDRAGLRCFFSPKAQIRYHPRSTLRGLFQQLSRYGRGRARLLWKHPETFSLSSTAPAVFFGGLLLTAPAAAASPRIAALWILGLAIYLSTVCLGSVWLSVKQRDARLLWSLPAVFAAIHTGAAVGMIWEMLNQVGCRAIRFIRPSEAKHEAVALSRHLMLHAAPVKNPLQIRPGGVLNALTIDVEDYFQVTGFESIIDRAQWDEFEPRVTIGTERILQALEDAQVRGTFFVLGWVAERNPRLVRRIRAAGHEIGCHSHWHRLVYRQAPDEFRADLRRARAALEDAIGEEVVAYRAPCFSITKRSLWALDTLIAEGFRFDSSIYPTLHDRYGIPGAPPQPHEISRRNGTLWEFPMAIHRVLGYPLPVGGGGYFRLYPYEVTRGGLRAINKSGRPFVAYLHPWELDSEQPRLRPGRMTAFRHYVNLARTEPRLRQMLKDFRFGAISDVYAELHSAGTLPRWDLSAAA